MAARSRNRPRPRLALVVALALLLLLLAATRATAAAELGSQYARALAGECEDAECEDGEDGVDGVDVDAEDGDDGVDAIEDGVDAIDEPDKPSVVDDDPPPRSRKPTSARAPIHDDDTGSTGTDGKDEPHAGTAGGLDDEGDPILADAADSDGLLPGESIDDDDPITRDAIETGVTFTSTAFVDAAELQDAQARHHRPSRWGRVDLSITWRRAWVEQATKSTRDDVLWLVATWRR